MPSTAKAVAISSRVTTRDAAVGRTKPAALHVWKALTKLGPMYRKRAGARGWQRADLLSSRLRVLGDS